ncbi:uncharacterized protein PG998_011973 [Apiospora kogelbergensis]|uniref:uncharacterized protein n=1 Tax=Apiospora kogelbergensis TaxID=1337665 RepID=UPI00312D588D
MERRTYESPMDWEYQTQGPMDPTSPFVRSLQDARKNNTAFGATRPGALAANSTPNLFGPSQSPNKPPQPSSFLRHEASSTSSSANTPSSSSQPLFQRTNTAPPFRNPAFTTPRKPFDMDPVSEVEDSPAATDADASDFLEPDTPDDNARYVSHMALTPARSKTISNAMRTRSPGKGEISSGRVTMFENRDKIRKRKRLHDNKDISGYRLPYKYSNELAEFDDPDTDDSTYEPNERDQPRSQRRGGNAAHNKGWFGNFLSTISKHPTAPYILGYWLTLAFNASVLGFALWILFNVYGAFRYEMSLIGLKEKQIILDEIVKCTEQYTKNNCQDPLPAIVGLCQEWHVCMHQNQDQNYQVRFGAKNFVEIFNTIFESMHWKTMAAFFVLILIFCVSGASLFKSTAPPNFTTAVPQHARPSQIARNPPPQPYYYAAPPRTPHRGGVAYMLDQDETPDTDASPDSARPQLLPPPYETPGGGRRRSPSKEHRSRSPTKSRSPSKRY